MDKRIVFMGSPEFAVPTLIKLAENFNLVGVVTQPDRQAGRGKALKAPPVKTAALDLQVPILQPIRLRKNPESFEEVLSWQPDLIVVAAFGQILKKNFLEMAEFGCVNVHASLLPRWRGASPINAAILNGDKETGITIMKMDAGIDTGNILSQSAISINDLDAGMLSEKLADLGAELLAKTLPKYFESRLKPQKQEESLATYAPMLKKEDGRLDFNLPAEKLALQIRAFSPWPGTFTPYKDRPLKVHAAFSVAAEKGDIGQRLIFGNNPAFHTSDGLLVLTTVQPAGKKRMAGDVFLRGARDWVQTT